MTRRWPNWLNATILVALASTGASTASFWPGQSPASTGQALVGSDGRQTTALPAAATGLNASYALERWPSSTTTGVNRTGPRRS